MGIGRRLEEEDRGEGVGDIVTQNKGGEGEKRGKMKIPDEREGGGGARG